MGFQGRFEDWERINVSELGWEGVPEPGSREAESSTPYGGEAGRRDRELDGGRGSKGGGGSGDMEKGEIVNDFKC